MTLRNPHYRSAQDKFLSWYERLKASGVSAADRLRFVELVEAFIEAGGDVGVACVLAEHSITEKLSEPSEPELQEVEPGPPESPDNTPKYKRCGDCGELLETKTAFMRNGRGGYRRECRMCFNVRYRNGAAGYKFRHSYKSRRST